MTGDLAPAAAETPWFARIAHPGGGPRILRSTELTLRLSALMSAPTTLVWYHYDHRVSDHPALCAAAERGRVVPVVIHAPGEEGAWAPGGAQRWWLHHSLAALKSELQGHDSELILRRGDSLETLRALIAETGASAVYFNLRPTPELVERDKMVAEALREDGVEVRVYRAYILHDLEGVRTGKGDPYKVFTPFWRKIRGSLGVREPLEAPDLSGCAPESWPKTIELGKLELLPKIKWDDGFYDAWTPGSESAHQRLKSFLDGPVATYKESRDIPSVEGTSRLSPHLHFGEISPREVWHTTEALQKQTPDDAVEKNTEHFLRELAWREFSHHVLHHHPRTPDAPLRPEYAEFPWAEDESALVRWQRGQTGYPIVDAGMRELWVTGYMHNRVRMVVASFLTKHLLIPWQRGAEWFWDTLVDADLANNTMGWQWAAGSGADAQPYFRIFNPITQGQKFDKKGDYVRRWVPELADLPDKYLHEPWKASAGVLDHAGVKLGETYPRPIVEHKDGRQRALDAFEEFKALRSA